MTTVFFFEISKAMLLGGHLRHVLTDFLSVNMTDSTVGHFCHLTRNQAGLNPTYFGDTHFNIKTVKSKTHDVAIFDILR